jgi:hypothetical protein
MAITTLKSTQLDIGTYTAWTDCTVTYGSSSGTGTITTALARYTRIGKTVHFRVDFTITDSGTAAGAIIIVLPTAAGSALDARQPGYGINTTNLKSLSVYNFNGVHLHVYLYTGLTAWNTGDSFRVWASFEVA